MRGGISLFDIQKKAASFTKGRQLDEITGVIIHAGMNDSGEDVTYSSGDSTGYVLEVDCPTGSQEVADGVLASLKLRGFRYQPFEADSALIDPACEIGDNITANGVQSIIFSRDTAFERLMRSTVSAPYDEEVDHEFNYEPRTEREFKRESAYARSRIKQTENEISFEVTRATTAEGALSSRISINANAITAEVTRATASESNLGTRIEQRLDGITLTAFSSAGSSTFTIKDGSTTLDTKTLDLTVKSVNISGTLTIGQFESTVQNKINGAVKRSSMIYYSKAASGAPTAPSSWISTTSASQETWTQTRPEYSQSYAYLYIARQTETEDGTYSCTTPTRDYTTTVIDGAHIITGTIDAAKISVANLQAISASLAGWTLSASAIRKTVENKYDIYLQAPASPSDSSNAFVVKTYDTSSSSWTNMFYVRYNGLVYAKNAQIEGKITATSGTIGGVSITNGVLTGIQALNIASKTLTASEIANDTITHSEVAYNTLSSACMNNGVNSSLGWGDAYGYAVNGTLGASSFYVTSLYIGSNVMRGTYGGSQRALTLQEITTTSGKYLVYALKTA